MEGLTCKEEEKRAAKKCTKCTDGVCSMLVHSVLDWRTEGATFIRDNDNVVQLLLLL